MTRSFLFVLASTRVGGNSELLARRAAQQLPEGATAQWVRLSEVALPPFADTRHSTGYGSPEGEARQLRDATLAATDLVIVTPVYWYGVAWTAKHYLDHWSGWMRDPELAFRPAMQGRRLWSVIADSDQELEGSSYPVIELMRRTADYMEMKWAGALLGHANKPGEIEQRAAAMAAAEGFFSGEQALSDEALWAAFHERTLTAAQWTHTVHLRMAWLHLARYSIDEAHVLMRVGIIRLNAAHGLVETISRGYHETMTRVWLALVESARRVDAGADSASFVATHDFSREVPLGFYSKARLFSATARAMFVEPDLAPLPG